MADELIGLKKEQERVIVVIRVMLITLLAAEWWKRRKLAQLDPTVALFYNIEQRRQWGGTEGYLIAGLMIGTSLSLICGSAWYLDLAEGHAPSLWIVIVCVLAIFEFLQVDERKRDVALDVLVLGPDGGRLMENWQRFLRSANGHKCICLADQATNRLSGLPRTGHV